MGAWGADSFQNDSAVDWLGDLCKRDDASLVQTALSRVVEHGGTKQSSASFIERFFGRRRRTDWLTAKVASQALAAAEVVAAWRGRPSATLPDNLKAWLQQNRSSFQPDILPLAKQAVSIVKTNSELKDLWEEGDASKWKATVENLEQRLN
jgi:hypothetical protein